MKPSRKDFQSANDVRWCPGCGDYVILATMQRILAELKLPKEKQVFVSGIGCAARFPYYMNTFGLHTIHGRAPAVATGLKLARPDLNVWVITGDGDSLSIGGNHTLHMLRRNVNLNVLLFNNEVYGLTKGQYSPTSAEGTVAKSTPFGSVDHPVNPLKFALGAGATFVARTTDTDVKHLGETIKRAQEHEGTSFVEIYQNCIVFNDNAFVQVTNKDTRSKNQLHLKDESPLLFDNDKKGIAIDQSTLAPYVIDLEREPERKKEAYLFKENDSSDTLAHILSELRLPEFPVPLGVFRASKEETFDSSMQTQQESIIKQKGQGDLSDLFSLGDQWEVK